MTQNLILHSFVLSVGYLALGFLHIAKHERRHWIAAVYLVMSLPYAVENLGNEVAGVTRDGMAGDWAAGRRNSCSEQSR